MANANPTAVNVRSPSVSPSPSSESEIDRDVDPISSAKPDQKFLIGVLLAVFIILAICFIFLIKPYVEQGLRRLINHQEAVDVCVPKKRRRRKPRLHEIWIDESAGVLDHKTPNEATWQLSHKPLALSLRHQFPPTYSENTTNTTNVRVEPQTFSTGVSTPNKTTLRGFDLFEVYPDSTPTPDETKHPCESLEPVDSMAQVCFFIAFPNPSSSRNFPLAVPGHSSCKTRSSTPVSHPDAENRNDENESRNYLPQRSGTEELSQSSVPSGLCLGISCSPFTLYQ